MTSAHELRPTDLPVTFGRYRLLDVLGQGGMARVYLGELQGPAGFRKQVAVKVLVPLSNLGHDGSRELFLTEARLGGLLRHPNIVDVYELGEEDDNLYIAMELVEGPSLLELLRERRTLPPRATLELALQLCGGLAHAHGLLVDGKRAGLVHRDLKPGNVLISPQGMAKIADFGIARVRAWQMEETRTFRGTPAWSAPEQLAGRPVDARADLFALGAILHRCIVGTSLFGGRGARAIRNKMVAMEKEFVAGVGLEVVDDVVPGLAAVLRSALRLKAANRIDSAQEMAQALRDLLTPELPGESLSGLMQPRGGMSHLPLPLVSAMDPPTEVGTQAAIEITLDPSIVGSVLPLAADFAADPPAAEGFDPLISGRIRRPRAVLDPAASDPLMPVGRPITGDAPRSSLFAPQPATTNEYLLDALASSSLEVGVHTEEWEVATSPPEAPAHAPASLPFGSPVSPFVGREQELAVLDSTLRTSRFVTIKGPPGVGKSRLVQSLARRMVQDGRLVHVVETDATTPEGAVQAVATALRLSARGAGPAAMAEELGRGLAGLGPVTLVLDGASASALKPPVERWLNQAHSLRVLVAGREPLGLDGETVLELEPLHVEEARDLFRLRSGLEVADAELDPFLDALDRLPLAIELAAGEGQRSGWEALLSRPQPLGDLAEGSPLAGAVRSSWEQLDDAQQTTLRRLSVFRRGFFLDAAEAVVLLGADGPFLFDVVESLLARSLVHVRLLDGEPRFALYEPIRAFAGHQLTAAKEQAAVEGRHAGWYARAGLSANLDSLEVRSGLRELRRLPLELDNLRAAADRAVEAGELRLAALCTLGEAELLVRRGPHVGPPQRLDAVLRAPKGPAPHLRVRLLYAKARLEGLAGRRSLAMALHDRALKEARALGIRGLEGRILSSLGAVQTVAGRLEAARASLGEALAVHREVGDRVAEGRTLGWYASLLRELGERDEAVAFYGRALMIDRAVGNQRLEGYVTGLLANLLLRRGDLDEAERLYRQSIGLLRATGSVVWEATMIAELGRLEIRRAEYEHAEHLTRHAALVHRAHGNPRNEAHSMALLGEALLYLGRLREACAALDAAMEQAFKDGAPALQGEILGTLAEVLRCQGDAAGALVRLDRAEQLLRAAPRARTELGKVLVRKAVALLDVGEHAAAGDSALEAASLADQERLPEESELRRLLVALRDRLAQPD